MLNAKRTDVVNWLRAAVEHISKKWELDRTVATGNKDDAKPGAPAVEDQGAGARSQAAVADPGLRKRLEALRDRPRWSCGGESRYLAIQAIEALDKGDVAAAGRLALDSFALDSDREKTELAQEANEAARQRDEEREKLAAVNAALNIPGLYVASKPGGAPATPSGPLLEVAAKVRQVPGSLENGPHLLHRGWIALARLTKEAYEAGAGIGRVH